MKNLFINLIKTNLIKYHQEQRISIKNNLNLTRNNKLISPFGIKMHN